MVPEAWRQPSEPCTLALRLVCVSACQLLFNNTGLSLSGDFATGWMGRSGRCGAQIWAQELRACRARHKAWVSWWLWTGQVVSLNNLFSQENHHNITIHSCSLLYMLPGEDTLPNMEVLFQLFNTTLWLRSKIFPAVVLLVAQAFISLCRKTLADSCDKSQPTSFTYRTLGVSCGLYINCPKVNFPWSKALSSTESIQCIGFFYRSLYENRTMQIRRAFMLNVAKCIIAKFVISFKTQSSIMSEKHYFTACMIITIQDALEISNIFDWLEDLFFRLPTLSHFWVAKGAPKLFTHIRNGENLYFLLVLCRQGKLVCYHLLKPSPKGKFHLHVWNSIQICITPRPMGI